LVSASSPNDFEILSVAALMEGVELRANLPEAWENAATPLANIFRLSILPTKKKHTRKTRHLLRMCKTKVTVKRRTGKRTRRRC
jgi:hypothetical protein